MQPRHTRWRTNIEQSAWYARVSGGKDLFVALGGGFVRDMRALGIEFLFGGFGVLRFALGIVGCIQWFVVSVVIVLGYG